MANKNTHLTQTGAEVQAILNEAQRVYSGEPSAIEQPDEGDICIIPPHDDVDAEAFEYRNGAWVSREDIDRALAKANTAYQKPASGIPASDIADGVIPDVSQFITRLVDDLVNYYTKSQTYTKEEVQQIVSSLSTGAFIPVAELPTASADTFGLKIYLVPSAEPQVQNIKDEFITVRSGSEGAYTYSWEQIGSTAIDLSDYVTEDALATVLEDYATKDELPQTLVSGQYVVPNPYSDVKTIEETAEEFGITEQQVRDLFDGKYAYIKFDKTVLSITVVSKDPSWCVKFVSKDDLVEYTLYGITIIAGTFILIGTTFYKYVAESTSRKVTTLSGESTDAEYPSAKAVYNAIKDAATAGMSYDSITESIVVEPPHGAYDQSTETITL